MMFEAFSNTLNRIVTIDESHNLNETFGCPNPDCPALLRIKSADGKKATHFSRFRGAPEHITDCPFDYSNRYYRETDTIIKSDLQDILDHTAKSKSQTSVHGSVKSTATSEIKYIHTPKQLLRYCTESALTTPYKDGLIVDDIILDSRNLMKDARFRGIEGIRFLIGTTIKYDLSAGTIKMVINAKTARGTPLQLTAYVFSDSNRIRKLKDEIFATYGHFSHAPIAVLGDWKKTKEYEVQCTITNLLCIVHDRQNLTTTHP